MPRLINLSDIDSSRSPPLLRGKENISTLSRPASWASRRVDTVIAGLLRCRLIEKMAATSKEQVWKSQGDVSIGLAIAEKGRALIEGRAGEGADIVDGDASARATLRTASKIQQVLALLGRDEGALPAALIDVTGWLPHSMRAALTGLRRKGHVIEREGRGESSVYRLTTGA